MDLHGLTVDVGPLRKLYAEFEERLAKVAKSLKVVPVTEPLERVDVVMEFPLKNNPTADDVHEDGLMGRRTKPKRKPEDAYKAIIVKADDEQRMAYGWASVISVGGEPVVDTQGDVIEPDVMLKAATEFMADARLAKAMHKGDGIGEVLHSFPLTAELAKSLGIETDREGWIVGVKVHSEDVWKRVKSGELQAFSIGGMGTRDPV